MAKSKVVKTAFISTLPVMAGYVVLGAGFGMILKSKGYGIIWAFLMSLFIYAGSMQFVAVNLLTGGASFLTTALTTLMVNARHRTRNDSTSFCTLCNFPWFKQHTKSHYISWQSASVCHHGNACRILSQGHRFYRSDPRHPRSSCKPYRNRSSCLEKKYAAEHYCRHSSIYVYGSDIVLITIELFLSACPICGYPV